MWTKSMLLPVTRDLAERLLAYEAVEGAGSEPTEPAFRRAYEKLRRHLCALVGIAGFQSLASRALTLARSEASGLRAVQIAADGSLQGIGELNSQLDDHETGEAEVILIAQLLGLLFTFIGEALTLQLVLDVWPEAALDDGDSGIRRNA
jgi:hypothetical protein